MLSSIYSPTETEKSDPFVALCDSLFTALMESGIMEEPNEALLFSAAFAQELKEKGWLLTVTPRGKRELMLKTGLEAHGVDTEEELRAIHESYKTDEDTFRRMTRRPVNGIESFGKALMRLCKVCDSGLFYGELE